MLHLCGNKWCTWPGHFFVGTKVSNDEQTACHKGLHNAASLEDYVAIQEHIASILHAAGLFHIGVSVILPRHLVIQAW